MAGARTNTRRMHRLRDEFFDEGRRLDADPTTRHLSVCWICKGRIDYTAGAGTTRYRIDEAAGIDRCEQLGERGGDGDAGHPGDLPGLARPMLESEAENGPERLAPPGLSLVRHSVIRRRDGCRLRNQAETTTRAGFGNER